MVIQLWVKLDLPCQKTFTDSDGKKIKGSGWCKAGCWAKTIATVALAVAAIIKATK